MLTMRRLRTWIVLGILMELTGTRLAALRASEPPVYEVYAVRYARLLGYPVESLVQGADPKRKLDLAMTVWVLKGPDNRTVLVDTGFYRPEILKRKDVADYTRPDKALERLGISAEQVTDVVITHMHWDHADGVDLFPKAQVWIQKKEYDHSAGADRKVAANDDGTLPSHYEAMIKLRHEGRVRLVDGDAKEIVAGVTVYTGGKHTFESQYVGVNTRSGVMVIASDNLYLYENLDKHVPIAQTVDAKSNLAAQDRMKALASSPRLIIPGHDPEVFVRFPKPGNGVARLD
jgi:glyoxylase-like metal-dependent hydrolase (beta-lactamase superfamily II)